MDASSSDKRVVLILGGGIPHEFTAKLVEAMVDGGYDACVCKDSGRVIYADEPHWGRDEMEALMCAFDDLDFPAEPLSLAAPQYEDWPHYQATPPLDWSLQRCARPTTMDIQPRVVGMRMENTFHDSVKVRLEWHMGDTSLFHD